MASKPARIPPYVTKHPKWTNRPLFLWVFFDLETTGLSIYNDQIREMGATVYDEKKKQGEKLPDFSSFVSTSGNNTPRTILQKSYPIFYTQKWMVLSL